MIINLHQLLRLGKTVGPLLRLIRAFCRLPRLGAGKDGIFKEGPGLGASIADFTDRPTSPVLQCLHSATLNVGVVGLQAGFMYEVVSPPPSLTYPVCMM